MLVRSNEVHILFVHSNVIHILLVRSNVLHILLPAALVPLRPFVRSNVIHILLPMQPLNAREHHRQRVLQPLLGTCSPMWSWNTRLTHGREAGTHCTECQAPQYARLCSAHSMQDCTHTVCETVRDCAAPTVCETVSVCEAVQRPRLMLSGTGHLGHAHARHIGCARAFLRFRASTSDYWPAYKVFAGALWEGTNSLCDSPDALLAPACLHHLDGACAIRIVHGLAFSASPSSWGLPTRGPSMGACRQGGPAGRGARPAGGGG